MPLSRGDGVAVVAPAGPVDRVLYEAGLALLTRRYQVVQQFDHLAPPHPRLPYLAGEDQWRADQLNRALNDPRVKAIFCARGGYGAMRILDQLDAAALVQRRIPIIGFSDCTALHLWAARHQVSTIHGPVVTQLSLLPLHDQQRLFHLLEGESPPPIQGLGRVCGGRRRGPLLGGNLSLLTHMLHTPHMPALAGCILLTEEIGEAPYRIDRMLTQLGLAGVLQGLAGVCIGTLERCDTPQVTALDVFAERLAPLGLPVVSGAPVGHAQRNLALPLGPWVELDAGNGTLSYLKQETQRSYLY